MRKIVAANDSVWWNHVTWYLCCRWNKGRIHSRLARFLALLQLNATNEIVAADAAADNNSNSSSADIFEVTSQTLIDSDSPAQILK